MNKSDTQILLIEDNPADQELTKEYLEQTKFNVANLNIVDRIEVGKEFLQTNSCNIVLLDLSLPDSFGLDGLEAILKLNPNLPVVILTGNLDRLVALDAIRHGAQDYLVKGEYDELLLEKTLYYALERQQLLIELKQAKRELMNALIEGQESERKRVAQELHDGLGQIIASAFMQCQAIQNMYYDKIDLSKPIQLLGKAVKEYRAISHDLLPPDLQGSKLDEACEKLCNEINSSSNFNIEFEKYCEENNELNITLKRGLYRIVQELIHNAIKHSNGSQIKVTYKQHSKGVVINVVDNGVGFDSDYNVKKSSGIGLKNINARLVVLDGKLTIESNKDKHKNVVSVVVPIL